MQQVGTLPEIIVEGLGLGVEAAEAALSRRAVANAAAKLGYKLDKGSGRMHGQAVFKNGNKYITRDVDQHSGGTWKMFNNQGKRIGTFDENLNKIGD